MDSPRTLPARIWKGLTSIFEKIMYVYEFITACVILLITFAVMIAIFISPLAAVLLIARWIIL